MNDDLMELNSPVNDSSWSKISEDPFKMWTFTNENLTDYFVFSNEKHGLEKQDWKSLNAGGYKLFAEGYVQDTCVCTRTEECLVKALCLPEIKKDITYKLLRDQAKLKKPAANVLLDVDQGVAVNTLQLFVIVLPTL